MASSSKPQIEETPEEIEARKRMILSGQQGGNLSKVAPGGEVMMNPDGSNGFTYMGGGGAASDGSNNYKWNEKTGDYRSHGGGIMQVGEMPQQQAPVVQNAPSAAPKKKKPKKDWREDIDYDNSAGPEGLPTSGIVDNEPMNNWLAMGPQTGQELNPLVDPNNWQTVIDPKYQQTRNLGRYVNPGVDEFLKGLLSPKKNKMGGLI